jgi:hypothetical protein
MSRRGIDTAAEHFRMRCALRYILGRRWWCKITAEPGHGVRFARKLLKYRTWCFGPHPAYVCGEGGNENEN